LRLSPPRAPKKVSALLVAAGESRRMGSPKALLPLGPRGETFLARLVATLGAAGVEDVIVVTGADADSIEAAARALPEAPRLVRNARYGEGQLSSLLAALQVADRPGVGAVLVALVDVPLVSADTVRRVLETYRRTHALIVRPVSRVANDRHGHPVVFDRALFEELRRADPVQGAKSVVRAHAADIADVPVDDDGAFLDVDTPEDYDAVSDRYGSDT